MTAKQEQAAKDQKAPDAVMQKKDEPVEDPDKEKGKPPTSEPSSTPAPTAPTAPAPNMPKGPEKPSDEEMGKSLYSSKCGSCHATKNVRNYTFSQWEPILKRMIPNAKLTAEEESYVVAYIRANAK